MKILTEAELMEIVKILIKKIPSYGEYEPLSINQSDAIAIHLIGDPQNKELAQSIEYTVHQEGYREQELFYEKQALQYLINEGFIANRQLTDTGRKLKELKTLIAFNNYKISCLDCERPTALPKKNAGIEKKMIAQITHIIPSGIFKTNDNIFIWIMIGIIATVLGYFITEYIKLHIAH